MSHREELRKLVRETQQQHVHPALRAYLDQVEAGWREYMEWVDVEITEEVLYGCLVTLMAVSKIARDSDMDESEIIPVMGSAISGMFSRTNS